MLYLTAQFGEILAKIDLYGKKKGLIQYFTVLPSYLVPDLGTS